MSTDTAGLALLPSPRTNGESPAVIPDSRRARAAAHVGERVASRNAQKAAERARQRERRGVAASWIALALATGGVFAGTSVATVKGVEAFQAYRQTAVHEQPSGGAIAPDPASIEDTLRRASEVVRQQEQQIDTLNGIASQVGAGPEAP